VRGGEGEEKNRFFLLLTHCHTEMDPSYSVILGDKTSAEVCGHKSGTNINRMIEIVVPVVVGLILLTGLFILFFPRYVFTFH
jgi:hypothetical protein